MFKYYKVGGYIRDKLLGVESSDIDFTAVPCDEIIEKNPDEIFDLLCKTVIGKGRFYINHRCFTIKVEFPSISDVIYDGWCDIVLARKDSYDAKSRVPRVILGTLKDDMERRDFTINALAEGGDGEIIDYFGGLQDLENKVLNTIGNARQSILDDPLRLLRAFRFSITRDFTISRDILDTCTDDDIVKKLKRVLRKNRISSELTSMFAHDTIRTIRLLSYIDNINPELFEILFADLKLIPK